MKHKPTDFKLCPILKNYLKLGTLVIFVNNSYTTDINGKQALPTFDESIFKIVGHNKPYPTLISSIKEICSPINNIKVQDIYNGKIYHCSDLNIKSIQYPLDKQGNSTVCYKGNMMDIKSAFCIFPEYLD